MVAIHQYRHKRSTRNVKFFSVSALFCLTFLYQVILENKTKAVLTSNLKGCLVSVKAFRQLVWNVRSLWKYALKWKNTWFQCSLIYWDHIEKYKANFFRRETVCQIVRFISHFSLKLHKEFWKYFQGMVLSCVCSD